MSLSSRSGYPRPTLSPPNVPMPPKDQSKDDDPNAPRDQDGPDHPRQQTPRHRFLTPSEWAILARGVGAVRDTEQHKPIHPTHWWWPPRGMVPGLYRNIVMERTHYFYLFHAASMTRWALMILQLFIGATLTALGPQAFQDGTPITILGALNTIIAGLLALIHNSGLPDRYRHNMIEFEELVDHIRELLDTGLAPPDRAIDQLLAECFDLYQEAKATVQANLPMTYNTKLGVKGLIRQNNASAMIISSSRPHHATDTERIRRLVPGDKSASASATTR